MQKMPSILDKRGAATRALTRRDAVNGSRIGTNGTGMRGGGEWPPRELRRGVYGPVTFSSRKSGCCMRVNSTAKPFSTWRTTRLGVLPSVISAPTSGG